ncbi:MAG: hypothetical protein FWH26_06045 [Oscillospiraceae bacterium]|nr:hypothetical protein [Oscillospiraceae bacterium]
MRAASKSKSKKRILVFCLVLFLVLAAALSAASYWIFGTVRRAAGTTAPGATARGRVGIAGLTHGFEPEDFAEDIRGLSPVTACFEYPPELDKPGRHTVSVILEDSHGNRSRVTAELRLLRLREPLVAELGEYPGPLPPKALFTDSDTDAVEMRFLEPPPEMKSPGRQELVLLLDGREYPLDLRFVDTTPPRAKTRDLEILQGGALEPLDFIEELIDATQVTAAFSSEPDWTLPGKAQTVEISLTDEGGNTAVVKSGLIVLEDKEPPVISGVREIHVSKFDTVAYRKGVTVTDNSGAAELTIDSAEVNTGVPGSYVVTYIARDSAGNETRVSTRVVVNEVSAGAVNALVDPVLKEIIAPGMSDAEKAATILAWIRRSVAYSNEVEKSSVIDGAHNGMVLRRGDCYTFFALAKYMLEREGIETVDMRRVEGAPTRHYWLALNFGNGWYHYDCAPLALARPNDGFMMSDSQAKAFGEANGRPYYYEYDPAALPPGVTITP